MGKILIIRHTDRDGIVSAAIIKKWLLDEIKTLKTFGSMKYEYNYIKNINENIIDIGLNYDKDLSDAITDANTYDMIIMVDYSISTPANVDTVINWKKEKPERPIIWIDHHVSSIKMEIEYPKLRDLLGFRANGVAGCALCWLWTQIHILGDIRSRYTYNRAKVFISSYDHYRFKIFNGGDINDPIYDKPDILRLLYDCKCPPLIIYTHRYDIWDHSKIDMTPLYFDSWYNVYSIDDIDPNELEYYITNDNICKQYIENGKKIFNINMEKNMNVLNQYGFESTLIFEGKTYKMICLNTPHRSSLSFGTKSSKYDIMCAFTYTGEKYSYSLYTEKDYVSCEKICVAMGGGGHAAAAGFVSDKLLIEKNKPFVVD